MPDMKIEAEENDVLSSFEVLSNCAHSDHILQFGRFIEQNLDYFGESERSDRDQEYSHENEPETPSSSHHETIFTESEGTIDEYDVIEEAPNESQ